MARFRSRVIDIEAVQFKGIVRGANGLVQWSEHPIPSWLYDAGMEGIVRADSRGPCLWIKTPEGTMKADLDDWIIRGTEGEVYPCKPIVFGRKYEEITNAE